MFRGNALPAHRSWFYELLPTPLSELRLALALAVVALWLLNFCEGGCDFIEVKGSTFVQISGSVASLRRRAEKNLRQ